MKFIIIEKIILFIISNYYIIPKTTTTTDCANGDAMVGKRTWYIPDKRMALCLIIFFFTRCIFSDIIRLNNLIFQVICRFRHLNSNIMSFAMIFFTLNFTKISDDIFGI